MINSLAQGSTNPCARKSDARQESAALFDLTLGQQAWRESGLGAAADIDALNQKITHLEQHVTDLRLQLEQKDQDLQAARAANRELMTQLNATIPAPRR
jgi:predicted  nucleic acid-binding Zn-ribbon protein